MQKELKFHKNEYQQMKDIEDSSSEEFIHVPQKVIKKPQSPKYEMDLYRDKLKFFNDRNMVKRPQVDQIGLVNGNRNDTLLSLSNINTETALAP